MTLRSALIALPLLALAACGGVTAVSSGTVERKDHVPAREWTTLEADYDTKCTGSGKSRTCKSVFDGYDEIEHNEPECWRLTLRDGGETGEVCVSREVYDRTNVGDFFDGEE